MTTSLNSLSLKIDFFRWCAGLDLAQKMILAVAYAGLTGLLAQVVFFLPGIPVPVTGQTFAVLLGAVLLGRWGGVAQAVYTVFGVAGVPWFAAAKSGLAAIIGPASGYAIGFVFAAFILGYWAEKKLAGAPFTKIFASMLVANFIVIYGFGLLQLYFWLSFANGAPVGLNYLLVVGALPFIAGDILKAAAAAGVAKILS